MKKFTLFISILLAVQLANAQITFQKTYGGTFSDGGYSVNQTTDGGYIISGYTNSFGSIQDVVYLIKTDANGDTLWTKTFGAGSIYSGHAYSVQQTTDGGYIMTGETNYPEDIYLIKIDSSGILLWSKTFSGISYDYGFDVRQTSDTGYIITGYTYSFGAGLQDVYLIKTDANGNTLWAKTYGNGSEDVGRSVRQTSDGGYIIAGFTISGVGIYLIKTDTIGHKLWRKTFGASYVTYLDNQYSVEQTTDGGYIIGGVCVGGSCLIKTDINGDTLWTKKFGGVGIQVKGYSVRQTSDGGYILSGYINSTGATDWDVYLIKTDAFGDTLWTKTYGGTDGDFGYSVQQTSDGGYIMAGTTLGFGSGNWDVYLIKTDSLGNSGCNQGSAPIPVTSPIIQLISTPTIVSPAPFFATNIATIVGSGGTVTTLCPTGINEIAINNSFTISPNPSIGNLMITFETAIKNGSIQILNILGENVFNKNIFNESKKEINLKNISNGIYFVRVFDGEKSFCKKLIVEHD